MTLAACAALLAPAALSAKEYTAQSPLILKMTSFAMPTHPYVKYGQKPWADELKEKSGGRLVVELYNPNTVCPDGEVYDCVQSGVIDIGAHTTQRVKGLFPLSGVIDLPFLYPTAETASQAFLQLVDEFPELRQEYAGAHLLGVWSGAPFQLHSVKRPIHTIEDMKGMKIGVTAASIVPIVQAMAATGVLIPVSDCYLAIQRGQVDVITVPYAFIVSSKVYEATKYSTTINMMLTGVYMCMNQHVYESMPADLRAILDESLGRDRFRLWGKVTDQGDVEDLATIKKAGQEVYVMPAEEILKGRETTRPVVELWMQECARRGKGEVAQALYERAVELAAQYAAQAR